MTQLRNWVILGIRVVALAIAAMGLLGLVGLLIGFGFMGLPAGGPARLVWVMPLVYVGIAALLYSLSRPLAGLLTRDLEDGNLRDRSAG